jgi:outer membrane protein assembly factor BamB
MNPSLFFKRSLHLMISSLLFLSAFAILSAAQSSSNPQADSVIISSGPTDVTTYHFDIARTGWYRNEGTLKPNNVTSATFGKIGFLSVDGKVDAQPLYLNSVSINGQRHNVVYAVTEHDSAYAFDADTGTQLWKISVLGNGESTSDNHGCGQISPEIGITDTPVIDRTLGPQGAMYFVAMTKDSGGHYHQRLHALDLTTGAELFGGPTEIQGRYPGTGDNSQGGFVIFDPGQYAERSGLLELTRSAIYLTFTSHCDDRPYTGWVMAYSATTLAQQSVLNVTPNGNEGAIWMAGAGMAADPAGNIYFIDGNGTFDTTLNSNGFPVNGDYGNAVLKLRSSGGLAVADYFAVYNTIQESDADEDLGSGGALVLPDLLDNNRVVHHLLVGAGKDSNIYLLNRDNMGKYNPNGNNSNAYQWLQGALPGGVWSMPAYFTNTIYYGSVGNPLRAFSISNAKLSTSPTSQSTNTFPYPGTTPAVSGSGPNAIVWAIENSNPAVLHAYTAANLAQQLYNSNQQGARDQFGPGNKFITPIIANGKVFVGTQTGVAVFGLLH